MDSSTESFEEIEESMMELVQRAEAFLAAFPSTSASSSGSSGSSSGSNDTSISSIYSHNSSSAGSSIGDGASDISTISGSGDVATFSRNNGANLSINSGASTSSGGTAYHSFGATSSTSGNSTAASVQRTISDDCVLVPGPPVPLIDLCASHAGYPRNLLRQMANSAPVLDSITLDDSINETEQGAASQATAVAKEHVDGPPAKRSKEEAVVNPSPSTDEPAGVLTCPICFESIFKKLGSSTICGHLFCHECIKMEIKLRKQCPLCKRKLTRNQIHPIYST